MHQAKQQLISQLQTFTPRDANEELEQVRFLNFLENNQNVYSRDNLTGHLTASSWIVNPDRTKTLLIHHNIYKCRAPLGGHADDNTNLAQVALEEAKEESGITNVKLLSNDICGICTLLVPQHQKRGKIVPEHFHFDIRYLLEADDTQALQHAPDEVSDVRRFTLDEIPQINIDIMDVVMRVIERVEQEGM